jgi:hypothetical protein
MIKVKYGSGDSTKPQQHHCQAHRKGEWLIYTCPRCDYELWDNVQTGETRVLNSKEDINHSGSYFPPAYQYALENRN